MIDGATTTHAGTSKRLCPEGELARTTLGASVLRVFAEGTRQDLTDAFVRIPVGELRDLSDEATFRPWFEHRLEATARAIARRNAKNARVQPGAKWGHGTKVLTIFLREMVAHSRFFRDDEVEKIEEDQKRLRENIEALAKTPEAKTLIARYIAKAGEQETRLEEIEKERRSLADQKVQLAAQQAAEIRNFEIK